MCQRTRNFLWKLPDYEVPFLVKICRNTEQGRGTCLKLSKQQVTHQWTDAFWHIFRVSSKYLFQHCAHLKELDCSLVAINLYLFPLFLSAVYRVPALVLPINRVLLSVLIVVVVEVTDFLNGKVIMPIRLSVNLSKISINFNFNLHPKD